MNSATVAVSDRPKEDLTATPRWQSILEGDYAISASQVMRGDTAPDPAEFRQAMIKHYLEPLRAKMETEVGALIKKGDIPAAYQSFDNAIGVSRIGPRVMLAVQYVDGSSEWFCELIKLGCLLRILAQEKKVSPGSQANLAEALASAIKPINEFTEESRRRSEGTQVFTVAPLNWQHAPEAHDLPEARKQELRRLFARNMAGVTNALLGEVGQGEEETYFPNSPFGALVLEENYSGAMKLLRDAVRKEGLHIRAGAMVPLMNQSGFDWVMAIQGLADDLFDRKPAAHLHTMGNELLKATRGALIVARPVTVPVHTVGFLGEALPPAE